MNGTKQHVYDALQKGVRLDGRKLDEFRELTITTDVASTAEGSAQLLCGETNIIAGVKADLGQPYPDKPDAGTLSVSAELRPISNPEFEAGPPSVESIEVARVIDRCIRESGMIDEKKLCIKEGEQVWMINVDICPLNFDGNLIDLGGLAAVAALQSAKMPAIKDGKTDYHERKDKLKLNDAPIPVTVFKIGEHLIVDPTQDEMNVADARLTVGSLSDGTICALQKGGDTPLTAKDIDAMLELALKTAKKLRKVIK